MPNRARDWLKQAERDFQQAKLSADKGFHEWACFIAQQAAEKSVKALHLYGSQEARGYSIAKLLTELASVIKVPAELIEIAKVLDNFYIPPRYPNGHPEGAPFEHYGPLQSEQALNHAEKIIQFVRSQMAKQG